MVWYIVACRGIVQAVYGAALVSEADAKAEQVEAETGFIARVIKVTTSRRPRVGEHF